MSFKNIMFDLDGTLTDPQLGITGCVMYALERFNIKVTERSELFKFIGPPLIDSFKEYYGFSDKDALRAVELYRERFSVKGLFENEIYDGIEPMLKSLKQSGKKIFLATSKPEEYAAEILKHFGIYQYFDYVAGNNLKEERPKKSDVIKHLMSLYPELTAQNTVMVGDRCYDVEGAHAFNFKCIAVEYGYGDFDELTKSGADYIVKTVSELSELLLS